MEITLNLGPEAAKALHFILVKTEPKARTEMRAHSKIFRQLREECMEDRVFIDKGEEKTIAVAKAGKVTMEETQFDFLKGWFNKRLEAGIPGETSPGFTDLDDVMEEVGPKKEKAK